MEASNLDGEVGILPDSEHVSLPIFRLRVQGVKIAKRLKPKKTRVLKRCCPCYQQVHCLLSPSTTTKDQELIFSIPCHAMIIVLNPVLLGVLQIEYQNKQTSPFETHPIQMWTFLTAIYIYSSVLVIKIYMRTQSNCYAEIMMNYVLLLSATLSSATLVSIFLPRLLLWFLVVIWACLPVILARHLLKIVLCWLFERIGTLTSHVF